MIIPPSAEMHYNATALQYGKTNPANSNNQWKAKLVSAAEVNQYHLQQYTNMPKLLNKGINHQHISDYELQGLSGVASVLSVLGIATVNGWSRPTASVSRLPFWVGAFSWLASMAIYPKLIRQAI